MISHYPERYECSSAEELDLSKLIELSDLLYSIICNLDYLFGKWTDHLLCVRFVTGQQISLQEAIPVMGVCLYGEREMCRHGRSIHDNVYLCNKSMT